MSCINFIIISFKMGEKYRSLSARRCTLEGQVVWTAVVQAVFHIFPGEDLSLIFPGS